MSMVHRSPWKTSMVIIHEIWERYNAYFEQGPQLGMALQNIFILDSPCASNINMCAEVIYLLLDEYHARWCGSLRSGIL